MSALSDLPRWARDLLAEARVARLGILDEDDRPRVLPVTFAVADGALVTAVDAKPKRRAEPARVRFVRRRPEAALTADRYSDDWDELAWVQVLGSMRAIAPSEDRVAMDALVEKYGQYREEVPRGPLLRLEPGRALCWRALER